jgi:hypothetical protein
LLSGTKPRKRALKEMKSTRNYLRHEVIHLRKFENPKRCIK